MTLVVVVLTDTTTNQGLAVKKIIWGFMLTMAQLACLNAGDIVELQNIINDVAANASNTTRIFIKGEYVGLLNVPPTNYPIILIGKGKDTTLNGNKEGTTLTVDWGATFEIKNLTVTNGSSDSRYIGGAIYNLGKLTINESTVSNSENTYIFGNGGGITNFNELHIENSLITGNTSDYHGGGIYNQGNLCIKCSTISNNSVISRTSGIYAYGGGIYNDSDLLIEDSILEFNAALKQHDGGGGGFAAAMYTEGSAVVKDSFIRNNIAHDNCGGVENDVLLTLENCAIEGNIAQTGFGAGIYNDYGVLNINCCTISDNIAQNDNGGGIFNWWIMNIKDSSIENNVAYDGGGIYNRWVLEIEDSCISGNEAQDEGGGIFNDGDSDRFGYVKTINTKIKENTAIYGGGIFNSGGGLFELVSTTVTKNTATGGPDSGGGIYNSDPSLLLFVDSIIEDNKPDNIFPSPT